MIRSHRSLKKENEQSARFLKTYKKLLKKVQKYNFIQIYLSESLVFCEWKSEWAICSKKQTICSCALLSWATWANPSWLLFFFMSNLRNSLTVTLLSWVICAQPLICPEQSERIAHSCSLKWEFSSEWGNEQWATLAFRSKLYFVKFSFLIVVTYHFSIAQEFQIPPPGPGWIHCERERERERERGL